MNFNNLVKSIFKLAGFEIYRLPKERPVINGITFDRDVNWLRAPMYASIIKSLKDYEKLKDVVRQMKGLKTLEIGGCEGTLKNVLIKSGVQYTLAPSYPEINIEERTPYTDESYDIVICDQVFEHLKKPWQAVKEIHRILKPNGLAICTSVFIYPYHCNGGWKDYYRYSPDGFRALFEDYFDVLVADGWGSAELVKLAYNHSNRGVDGSAPIPIQDVFSMKRDATNHIMTWCLARKR